MEFIRARKDENKQIRLNQIKDAAIKELNTKSYQKISLSSIGRLLDFNVSNLYKYVQTKEDIYLYVLIDELKKYTDDLELTFSQHPNETVDYYVELLIEVLQRNQLYFRLSSIVSTIIETNSNPDLMLEFLELTDLRYERCTEYYGMLLPGKSSEDVVRFIAQLHYFIRGMYWAAEPNKQKREVYESLNITHRLLDFRKEIQFFITTMINGL